MDQVQPRAALAALLIAGVTAFVAASPALDIFHGRSIDLLTALHWRVFGNAHQPAASPAVAVVFDEETFRTPPFEGTPTVTWTREIGQVLTALIGGGAKVVGFDIVLPTSIEQSAMPFGDETLGAHPLGAQTLGARVRGFDRDYLRALAAGARAGKVVLGQVQHQQSPVLPSPGQRAAIGHGRNIRALNVHTDHDDVIRRVPLWFEVDGERIPSMAAELAARATGRTTPAVGSSTVPDTVVLNFEGGADDIPTYSFADLSACATRDDKEFFRKNFAGKVVLIGTVLDVEDRKITSKRFATAPEGARAARCALLAPPEGQTFKRDSIPGVYIHATAVNNLIRGDGLTEFGPIGTGIVAFILSALAALAALALGPVMATLATLGIIAAWVAAATAAFGRAVALPVVDPGLAAVVALGATVGYRFVVADKGKRLLRQSFALYLAPSVIEKMLASNKPPALGGETRNVTVYFSDIANFSTFAETIPPTELVAAMNEYLSAMTDVIEAHGGFVDKYIGDAIVAVFGAPLDDSRHASNAVHAALQCAQTLGALEKVRAAFGGSVRQRIGLNSGEALVGNIGSRRRFNYTVMGDMVNLASRLEGANKLYGTTIIASDATVAQTGPAFTWRELDAIRVKGRTQAVKIYEPLGERGQVAPELTARAQAYAEGLARYRARDFKGAAEQFASVAADDPPSALFLQRVKKLAHNPPGPDWEPVSAQDEK
ncbi:MAG: adenylate/guanylate cyclase domain-containing protein [Xanthobacteraceae bacterium]|nr:adenylate/guanylate cyclase domain-containing protein [Xanthobacteraceae bacterium]